MDLDFLQIGAHIGNTDNDPVFPKVKNGDLKTGIVIEPNPNSFKELVENYSENLGIIPLQLAVSDFCGEVSLFVDNFFVAKGNSQHSSLYLEFQHAHHHGNGADVITEVKVNCLDLNSIFKIFNIKNIGHLFVDTEGNDFKILVNTDFNKVSINIIQFEKTHLDGPHLVGQNYDLIHKYLESFGYNRICDTGEDLIFKK